MNISTKTILAAATALGTIGAAWGAIVEMTPPARGILESGPLPFPGRAEVDTKLAALAGQIQQMQKWSAEQARDDVVRDKLLSVTRQQQLEGMLAGAKADYYKSPTASGHAYVCALIAQIDQLRSSNGFPQITPCQ